MKPTHFRKPKTGDNLLRVQFRNGTIAKQVLTADGWRWTDTGHDFDIVAVEVVPQ